MTTQYTVSRQGSGKAYQNELVQVTVYPKGYLLPMATVKVAPMMYSSAEISRTDAANMLLKIRKASQK